MAQVLLECNRRKRKALPCANRFRICDMAESKEVQRGVMIAIVFPSFSRPRSMPAEA